MMVEYYLFQHLHDGAKIHHHLDLSNQHHRLIHQEHHFNDRLSSMSRNLHLHQPCDVIELKTEGFPLQFAPPDVDPVVLAPLPPPPTVTVYEPGEDDTGSAEPASG